MQSGRARLRDWIDRTNVNQTKAAEILGVHQVVLSQWLGGARTPGLENAVRLEQITGISVESWLLTDVSAAPDDDSVTEPKPVVITER